MLSRRVMLRTLLALPILLCLAGWLWSSTHTTLVGYGYGDRGVYLGTGAGALQAEWVVGHAPPGWWLSNQPLAPPEFWPSKPAWADTSFLGVFYGCFVPPGVSYQAFAIPYWFLIVVSGGLFAWVWRKTRRKSDPQAAFPVELAAAAKPDEKKP